MESRDTIWKSYVFLFLAVSASGFPTYDYFNLLKFILLGFSFFICFLYVNKLDALVSNGKGFFLLYAVYLLLNIRAFDDFSLRIAFNLLVTYVAAVAVERLVIGKKESVFAALLALGYFCISYAVNVNLEDGKQQVHSQLMTVIPLIVVLFKQFLPNKSGFVIRDVTIFLVVLVSNVRSVLFGFVNYLVIKWRIEKESSSLFSLLFLIAILVFEFTTIILNIDVLSHSFGSAVSSLVWRVNHWNFLFDSFGGTSEILFGKGLGASWRDSLFSTSNFFETGYVATHSNYVKIFYDTGLVGIAVFLSYFSFLFIRGDVFQKTLIAIYLGYGFFDEGIWLYSIYMLAILHVKFSGSYAKNA